MPIRSLILALALGCLTGGCVGEESAADDPTATETQDSTSLWNCKNKNKGVFCSGLVSVFPITIDIKNVRALNKTELNILNVDLSNLSILSQNDLDIDRVLTNVEVTVLDDFLNKLHIFVTKNDVDVCGITVLGGTICK
jgi:hypothetical protein